MRCFRTLSRSQVRNGRVVLPNPSETRQRRVFWEVPTVEVRRDIRALGLRRSEGLGKVEQAGRERADPDLLEILAGEDGFRRGGDLDAYATNDLVAPHPTRPGLWKLLGRRDDQIVLSNGEKVSST